MNKNVRSSTRKLKPILKSIVGKKVDIAVRDLSFSVKDFSKLNQLNDYILKFDDEFLKEVFVFDYFHNEKNKEIKIGFRFIFQATSSTITETQVNNIINDIIFHSTNISGVTIPGLNKN